MIAPDRVGAVLLAAGRSRRFGADDKLQAEFAGQPLAAHAAQAIAGLGCGVNIVVTAARRSWIPPGFAVVENTAPERGLSHSIGLGVAAMVSKDVDACLILLADMPHISTAHLAVLLAAFPDAGPEAIVASGWGGVPMVPALYGRAHFPALHALSGDSGGKDLLRGAILVEAPAGMLADIDTPADLAESQD